MKSSQREVYLFEKINPIRTPMHFIKDLEEWHVKHFETLKRLKFQLILNLTSKIFFQFYGKLKKNM